MDHDMQDQLVELRRLLCDQQVRLDEQSELIRSLVAAGDGTRRADPRTAAERSTRRDVLRIAGAGLAGAVGSAALTTRPAAATTGDPLIAGQTEDAETSTRLVYEGPPLTAGGAFVAGTGTPPLPAPAAGILGYVAKR